MYRLSNVKIDITGNRFIRNKPLNRVSYVTVFSEMRSGNKKGGTQAALFMRVNEPQSLCCSNFAEEAVNFLLQQCGFGAEFGRG